ncbi:hypothetical protein ACPPVU_21650 [Mucilaginibacter sp. McL0603]|uniref:hypothetical protein n=1 Tax=Mucilaginibacter sp. McL0603 TaxID=3415670 RepID=UPI003CFACD5F
MKATFQFFKKYPISIICYILFTWLCYDTLKIRVHFHKIIKDHLDGLGRIAMGKAVACDDLFFVIISGIFFLVILANAIVRKDIVVYGSLCLIIVIQALVALNAG